HVEVLPACVGRAGAPNGERRWCWRSTQPPGSPEQLAGTRAPGVGGPDCGEKRRLQDVCACGAHHNLSYRSGNDHVCLFQNYETSTKINYRAKKCQPTHHQNPYMPRRPTGTRPTSYCITYAQTSPSEGMRDPSRRLAHSITAASASATVKPQITIN